MLAQKKEEVVAVVISGELLALVEARAEIALLRATVHELTEWIRLHGDVPKHYKKVHWQRVCQILDALRVKSRP